jgi:ComF family protein
LGALLAAYLLQEAIAVDVVLPVPLHPRRRRQRGFNQSELLARILAERIGLDLDTRSLIRSRNTPQQTRAHNRDQREQNLRDAFRCRRPDSIAARRILLVDDVLTTGATARECARTLKAAGAAEVVALSFCHVDLHAGF